VQVLSGLDAAKESIRGGGVSMSTAASFSFSPENFLTLFAPRFFGDQTRFPYWGHGYAWEMSLFFGVGALLLALAGIWFSPARFRLAAIVTISVCLVLALGRYTPLFEVTYHYLPGF